MSGRIKAFPTVEEQTELKGQTALTAYCGVQVRARGTFWLGRIGTEKDPTNLTVKVLPPSPTN